MVDREIIHRAVEELTPESLDKLGDFIAYLKYTEQQGTGWIEKLYHLYAPVREAVDASGMSEDEINAFLDNALDEVRRERSTPSRL